MSLKGRLSISTALSRNTSLDSSYMYRSDTTSASVSQAEREIKKLREENGKLRKEIKDIRSLYNQLIQENSHEKFDERRIMLIKSQVIQLERQVLMMSEALSSRSETLTEVENALTWMANEWRHYISQETKSPEVPVKRSDLIVMVETAESARIKLYKNLEDTSVRNLTRPQLFMNEFVKPGSEGEITLLDIASGQLDHLNLKHVAKLETKLATLYKELISFHSLIEDSEKPSLHPVSHHTNKATQDRMITKLLKSCAMIKDCCGDLVQLSLLYPSAPWPPLKKSALKDLTNERIMKSLPPLPKSKTKEIQSVIESVLKAVNYKHSMISHETKSLKEDLKFHKSVYDLQLEYIQSLFEAVKDGYKKFEESTKHVITDPLKDVLKTYDELKSSASENALKDFLSCFKQNAEKLENAVEQLSVEDDAVINVLKTYDELKSSASENALKDFLSCFKQNAEKLENAVEQLSVEDDAVIRSGSEALTQFGEDFFYSLDKLVSKCQRNRDRAVKQRADLKEEQERIEQELRNLLDEQELKYKEHFVETHRSDFDASWNSNKNSPQREIPVKSKGKIDSSTGKDGPLLNMKEDLVHNNDDYDSTHDIDQKLENNKKLDLNNRNKWNDDVSCPPTFNNIDFIYKEDVGNMAEDVADSDNPHTLEETKTLENQKSFDSLPPVVQTSLPKKSKPKRNYTPNLVVPNRTLQLRRSGSLSKLSETSETSKQLDSIDNELSDPNIDNKIKLTRSRSSSKDRKNIPQKPPFR